MAEELLITPSTAPSTSLPSPEALALAQLLQTGKYLILATDGTDVQLSWRGLNLLEKKMLAQYLNQHLQATEQAIIKQKNEAKHTIPATDSQRVAETS